VPSEEIQAKLYYRNKTASKKVNKFAIISEIFTTTVLLNIEIKE